MAIPMHEWPACDFCEKPVEKMTYEEDNGNLIATAYCHGQTETTIIPKSLFTKGPLTLYGTTAFAIHTDLLE